MSSSSPLLDEHTEEQLLLHPPHDIRHGLEPTDSVNTPLVSAHKSISDSWKWYHTATVLCIRLIIDFVFKNPLVFYLNYQQGLGINYIQFAYILIASEFGCILAIFIGDINKKYLKTEENIMLVYLFICGIACILLPGFSYFGFSWRHNLYIIIWCCIMRFIVGVSFAFISAASIKFASQYVSNPNKITSIIAILHYSWPLSTAINIAAGYIIFKSGWMLVFVYSGAALILVSIGAKLVFTFFPLGKFDEDRIIVHDIARDEEVIVEDIRNGLWVLITDLNSLLIIFVSFFMTLRSRTIYIVTSSLWMENTFGLNASMVGWTTLSVIIGEVIGLAVMSTLSHKWALWKVAVGTLAHQLIFGAILFILAAIYGNDITLEAALILTALLTMGHESFYVVQQSNAIHYAPLPRLKFLLLLGERTAQESASIIALIITVSLWMFWGNNAIFIFSIIWIATTFVESFILLLYKSEPTIKESLDEV